MAYISNLFLPFQALNQIVQTYVSSQKITTPFTISNIISIAISVYFGWKFIIQDGYLEIGFCYTRLVQEVLGLTFSVVVMIMYSEKQTLKLPTFSMLTKDFCGYLWYNLKTAFNFYGECFSFELNTYLPARLGELDQLAAYIAIINAVIYIYFISMGFANTFRTNIGNTLGAGKVQEAKSNSIVYTFYVLILTLFFICLVELFIDPISEIYSGKNETTPIVKDGIRAYYWNIFPTFILYAQSSILRFLNHNGLAINTTVFIMPICVLLFSWFLGYQMGMKTVGLIYGFFGSKLVAMAIFFYVIYTVDWEVKYAEFKKEGEINDEVKEIAEEVKVVVDMENDAENEAQMENTHKEEKGGNYDKEDNQDLEVELVPELKNGKD